MAQEKNSKLSVHDADEKREPSLTPPKIVPPKIPGTQSSSNSAAKPPDDQAPAGKEPVAKPAGKEQTPPPLRPVALGGEPRLAAIKLDSMRVDSASTRDAKPAADMPSTGKPTSDEPGEPMFGEPMLGEIDFDDMPPSMVPPQLPPQLPSPDDTGEDITGDAQAQRRRAARRRPAGPSRNRIAANDDGPSIGGLIYALQQKPSNAVFKFAGIASLVWAAIGSAFSVAMLSSQAPLEGWVDLLTRPTTFFSFAAVLVPIGVMWLLALLAWRAEELRLRSSTMTEVAIRLAEPDRLAEQSIASLGQAVRRQVSFMNDAISRALGRAGELEALVHNEVTLLERSYEENERKIRGLIQELSGERHALVNTSDHVSETLQRLGGEIPNLIEKLSSQQVKLAKVIEGAGDNLTMLETSLATSVGNLESAVGTRSDQLQGMLETYTAGLAMALGSRSDQLQATLEDQMQRLDTSFGARTENLQTVFEEYARALDTALANRAESLDAQLIERTQSLDEAFAERLRLFDESIMRSTSAIDSAVVDKTEALTKALDAHAASFRGAIGRQASDLDDALMHGINSVRRASENITRQSIKAMEGLSSQSEALRKISEEIFGQISGVTGRFENQGQAIIKAADALENANYKIDRTLQSRHAELTRTLEQLSGKADEFAHFVEGYSTSMEGSLSEADVRARAELERMREHAATESERTLEDLRHRLTSVSSTMTTELGSLTDRFATTSEEMRQHAQRAAAEIAAEQNRLREQLERLPVATHESSEGMRRALQDQIRALDQLSARTARAASQRDVMPPSGFGDPSSVMPPPRPSPDQARSITSLSSTIAEELGHRQRQRSGPARQSDARESWSLGDLLARASRDDEGAGGAAATASARPQQTSGFNLDLEAIARALDPATAAAIWSRLRAGQRGVMVRSIYSDGGRALFDDLAQRCHNDPDLARGIGRYLTDFERAVAESDLRDPSGQQTHGHLISDAGRVYLFLGHAFGRLG